MKGEKNKDDVHLSLLNKFKSNDGYNNWIDQPFNVFDKTVSTNRYILIATPLKKGFTDKSEKVKSVYPMVHNMERVIKINEIKQKLNGFESEHKDCPACHGVGEVDFKFKFDGQTYETEAECPVCDGKAIIELESEKTNEKKEFDYNKFFAIGNSVFNVARIDELLDIAKKLQCEEVILVNQTQSNKPSLFKIKDVEVLLMPMSCSDFSNVYCKI